MPLSVIVPEMGENKQGLAREPSVIVQPVSADSVIASVAEGLKAAM